MGSTITPEKCISISKSGIIFGRKVAGFFNSRGTILVNVILNYNNNSMIISDTGLREDILLNHANQGLKINYENKNYRVSPCIKLTQLVKFLNLDYITIFKAKPFKGNSVIIENIPLADALSLRGLIVNINMKSKIIMFGNTKQCKEIKLEDITPSQNNLTATPSQPKTQMIQSTATPSQPKTPAKPIGNRRYGPNDVSEIIDENSPLTIDEEKANKEYSKMILGE